MSGCPMRGLGILLFSAYDFETDGFPDCRLGDGQGGQENNIGRYTKEDCLIAAREQYPNANGATMAADCSDKCWCYAEIGMKSWSGTSYQACMFYPGEYSSSPSHCRMRDESSMFSSPEFKNLIFLCSF